MNKRRVVVTISTCLLAVASVTIGWAAVYAHTGGQNDAENRAPSECYASNRFTIWANDSATGSEHSQTVTVNNPAQDSITLYLHRAGYRCWGTSGSPMGVFVTGMSITNGLSLSNVPTSCLNFGSNGGSKGNYTDSGTTYSFSLNGLTGLPYGTTNATLTINRKNGGSCNDSNWGDGSTATEYVTLSIHRKGWDIASASAVSGSPVDYKGSVTFTHKYYKYDGGSDNVTGRFGFNEVEIPKGNSVSGQNSGLFEEFTSLNLGTYYDLGHALAKTNTISYNQSQSHIGFMRYDSRNKTMNSADIGQKICQRARFFPNSAENQTWESPDWQCAAVYSPWAFSATTTGPTQASGVSDCLTADKQRSKPVCSVVFSHTVRESNSRVVKDDSGNDVSVTATVQYSHDGGTTWKDKTSSDTPAPKTSNQIGENGYIYNSVASSEKIDQSDVGKNVCQRVKSSQTSRDNYVDGNSSNNTLYSTPVCVYIPYNYDTTNVSVSIDGRSDGDVIEWGQTIGSAGSFDISKLDSGTNLGTYATKSKETAWQLSYYLIAPNNDSVATGGKDAADPCGYFSAVRQPGVTKCERIDGGTIGEKNPGGVTAQTAERFLIPDTAVIGSKFCFAFSVKPAFVKNDVVSNQWNHSAPKCLRVGKKPKVQTHNGGVSAPGGISSSVTDRSDPRVATNTGVFGSWSEYEAISLNKITGLGSVAAFNNGLRTGPGVAGAIKTDKTQASYSAETFGNIAPNGSAAYGYYGNTSASAARDLVNYFQNIAKASPVAAYSDSGVLSIVNDEATYYNNPSGAGAVLDIGTGIDGSTITVPQGHTAIIYNKGDINIANNIVYSNGPHGSARDIPQVVIISSGNIRIKDSVSRIDAWLIANNNSESIAGTIFTCATGADWRSQKIAQVVDSINNVICGGQLTVNGPVYAEKLHMLRTYGADAVAPTNPNTPAEIFNLPSSTYLWAHDYAARKNVGYAVTKYQEEKPPRY